MNKFEKVAYIAGPYRAKNRAFVLKNIQVATEVAAILRERGIACVVPHLESLFNEDSISEDMWLDHGLALLRRCDVMVLLDGWKDSVGTICEMEFAEKNGIKVFDNALSLITWINGLDGIKQVDKT